LIVVDTSALMAIVGKEAEAERCAERLLSEATVLISAGTLSEALIVAGRRNLREEMDRLIAELRCEVDAVNLTVARGVAEAYGRWGKGVHAARLNLGDCFAYELAVRMSAPLLFIGEDFTKTDIQKAL